MSEWKETELGLLPSTWKVKKVDEIKEDKKGSIAMGPFGSDIKTENFVSDGVPIIRGNNLNDFIFGDREFVFLTEEKADSLRNSICYQGDIIFTHRGTIGQVGIIPQNSNYKRYVVSQSGMKLTINKEIVCPEFIHLFFKSRVGQYILLRNKSQVGVPAIGQPTTSLKEMIVPIPPKAESDEIAKTILSIQNKITLLRQQNQDLEELAQTLFKRWFVEFEFPNENGEPYKSSGGKMVESELGEIPEGWKVGFFNELIADSIGGDYGKEELIDDFTEETTCLRGTDLPDMKTGLPLRAPVRYIKASKLNKCKLESGDLVIEISGGTEGQSTGRAIYINDDILSHFDRPMTCVNFCRILRPQEKVYSYFTYLFIDHLYRHRVFFNLENGSTGIKNLDLKTLLNDYEIQLPINNLILRFDSVVNKNFVKIQRNNKEIQTLTQLRDTLLPKLMSGELKVRI